MSLIKDFNDSYFTDITEYMHELIDSVQDDFDEKPKLSDILELVFSGIRTLPDDALADVNIRNIDSVNAKLNKRKYVKLVEGDVIAIPLADGQYVMSVYIGSNRFGCAYGIFHGVHRLRFELDFGKLEPWFAEYSGKEAVVDGSWPKIGNDVDLLSKFSSFPPRYYYKKDHPHNNDVGPFGSAEYDDRGIQHLTESESNEAGLLDGSYEAAKLESQFVAFLTKKIKEEG